MKMFSEDISIDELYVLKITRVKSILKRHKVEGEDYRDMLSIVSEAYQHMQEMELQSNQFNAFLEEKMPEEYIEAVKQFTDRNLQQYIEKSP